MNKGLEVIEAKWLFDIDYKQIEVLIHPESVIHSMVEYIDGSTLAQMGICDMRLPISYALYYPGRVNLNLQSLNLTNYSKLTFINPDLEKYRSLRLAYNAIEIGRSMPAVLNAANEVAREAYLNGKIGFLIIPEIVEKVMLKHKISVVNSIYDVIECDKWAREEAIKLI
jgi:1-deoxy-D-xylulose-5-phosphate reductoisomerase